MSLERPGSVFKYSADDPLAEEHRVLTDWIREAFVARTPDRYYESIDLKELPSGQILLASSPERGRLFVLAALQHLEFWNVEAQKVRESTQGTEFIWNPSSSPRWPEVQSSRIKTQDALSALLRRNLPFGRDDLLKILSQIARTESSYGVPVGHAARTFERYAHQQKLDQELEEAARQFAAMLRQHHANDVKRIATRIDQLCSPILPAEEDDSQSQRKPAPAAACAGDVQVLTQLKVLLAMLPVETAVETTPSGPDRYPVLVESPLAAEHAQLASLLEEKVQAPKWNKELKTFRKGQEILSLDSSARGRLLIAAMERHMAYILGPPSDYSDNPYWKARSGLDGIVGDLGQKPGELDRSFLFDAILYLAMRPHSWPRGGKFSDESDTAFFGAIRAKTSDGASLTEGERFVLSLWRSARILGPYLGKMPEDIALLTRWIGDGARYFLVPGEVWSDALNEDLAKMPVPQREKWLSILGHAMAATGARPSAKWQKTALALLHSLGEPTFRAAIERWLPLVARGRSHKLAKDPRGIGDTIHDENATALRGFLWLLPVMERHDGDARLVGTLAFSAYKKVPGVGPRAVKVGNAAVYALSEMLGPESLAQLAMLKVRVRFGTAQKEVEKAFEAAARELQLPREEVEEISIPDCGLQSVGLRQETFGDYRVRVEVKGSEIETKWFDAKNKPLNSLPSAVKRDHAEAWKELQGDLKDLAVTLSAQKGRIDGLFLDQRTWPMRVWRERYIDHPVIGTIARRLIWNVDDVPVTFFGGEAQDVDGNPVAAGDQSVISLWHPAGRSVDEIVSWRRRVEAMEMVQPFKQAHREIYILTDAERRTERYSNRFAAHILRQHQFSALCGARSWKNKLRLMVDDEYPPASRHLPAWGLRAEFWIEGIGDSYGQDTNESGTYLRLASDQVRFYRMEAAQNSAHAGGGGYRVWAPDQGRDAINEPLRMEEIPTLVFSEIMRDVDLFVGVASIGNDPTWQDGGGENRYGTYWHQVSFGELSATAISRREILERLVPRLKIAAKCTLSERFLLVQGTRTQYKIHLGSGNILMEPNDQYLCIVPDAATRSNTPQVYLPFEGDTTLSIILSKAFLLANDAAIKDPVILRQLPT